MPQDPGRPAGGLDQVGPTITFLFPTIILLQVEDMPRGQTGGDWYKSMWPTVGLEDTQVRITISTLVLLVTIFTLDLNFRTVNGQEKESTSRGALYAGGHLH